MTLQLLMNAIFQLIIFSLIPFFWWFIRARKKEKLTQWIGLIKPKLSWSSEVFFILLLTLGIKLLLGNFLANSFEDRSVLADYQFVGLGLRGIMPVLIYSFLQTGLSEEILFRGFFGKRLFHRFGFEIGNVIQATIFGLAHGVLLFGSVSILLIILVVVFTFSFGLLMGYTNEKIGNGSIIPSWIIHGLVNMISAFPLLF